MRDITGADVGGGELVRLSLQRPCSEVVKQCR